MKYTIYEIFDYINSIDRSDEHFDDFDEEVEANALYEDFHKSAYEEYDGMRDGFNDSYWEAFEKSYPRNLDLFVGFIIAGGLELSPAFKTGEKKEMPDLHRIIKEVYNDESFIHVVCDKYFPSEFDWDNAWFNSWGDGRAFYYRLASECKKAGGPNAYIMSRLIVDCSGQRTVYLGNNPYSNMLEKETDSDFFASASDIDVCVMKMLAMLYGKDQMIDHMLESAVFDNKAVTANKGILFDRVIFNTGCGKTLRSLESEGKDYLLELAAENPRIVNCNTSDWLHVKKASELISENGKAVVIVSAGSLVNKKDAVLRKMLIDEGMIEAVVSLPVEKLYFNDYTSWLFDHGFSKNSLALVILSHENETVRLVDLQSMYEVNKEKYAVNMTFNGNGVVDLKKLTDDLCTALFEEDKPAFSKTLTYDDLAETDFSLSFVRYSAKYDLIVNGVPFGKVIKSIRRGVSLKDKLEELKTNEPTDYSYLLSADVNEIITHHGLQSINEPDDKLKKYCLKNNNIVITKNGSPKKTGIVATEDNKLILASDNCFIIELDTELINPYYLAAYLNTDKGKKALDRISVGTSVKAINVSNLREDVVVPCPPLKEQAEIAEKYQDALIELSLLRMREAELRDNLTNVFFGEA